MKIVRAYTQDAGVEVVVLFPDLDLFTAVAKMGEALGLFNAPSPPEPASPAPEQAALTSTSTEQPSPATDTGRRRRRTAAEMEAARAAETPPAVTESTSRRRRAPAPVSTDPMPITDAELSKAASHTADELVKLGEDGPGLVMAVLEDYGVKSVGEIAVDRREAFIRELAKELDLAQQEHASQHA